MLFGALWCFLVLFSASLYLWNVIIQKKEKFKTGLMTSFILLLQFSRIAKCRLRFCDFLQEFAQISHEFTNTKHTLNLLLLKSSDLEIKRPSLLGKNNKKKLDERSKPVFCLSWLHYSLLLQFVCFFRSTFLLYYILNVVNKF